MRILGAIVIVVALSGCAQQPSAVEPGATITPDSETVLVDVARPAQVFGGDCSAIFSDAALSEALGQPLTQPWLGQETPSLWVQPLSPESALVEHAGGVRCTWAIPPSSPDSFGEGVLYVSAVPASAVSAPEDERCVASDLSATGCPIDVTANGIRLSGVVTSDIEGADPRARVAAVEALFVTAANAADAPIAPTPPPGSWQAPSDCAAIAASIDWKVLGEPGPVTADGSMGTDAYSSVVEVDLRGGRWLYTCWIGGETWQTAFSLLGGGAWARDAVLAQEGAEVVEVPGLDLVVTTPAQGGIIDIFDGVNWLQSPWGSDVDAVMPALEVVVDTLNATQAP